MVLNQVHLVQLTYTLLVCLINRINYYISFVFDRSISPHSRTPSRPQTTQKCFVPSTSSLSQQSALVFILSRCGRAVIPLLCIATARWTSMACQPSISTAMSRPEASPHPFGCRDKVLTRLGAVTRSSPAHNPNHWDHSSSNDVPTITNTPLTRYQPSGSKSGSSLRLIAEKIEH
jgi:hypothetical protein